MPVFKLNDIFARRYRLSELLGEGDRTEIWKAKDQQADGTAVTLKIYIPESGQEDYGARQFRREFILSHNLSHPHLLKASHFDVWEGFPYLLMPFCAGGSLSGLLKEEKPFSKRQIALLMCQIGSALEDLHRQKPPILHRNIKPTTIFMARPGSFLLAGIGAREADSSRGVQSGGDPKPADSLSPQAGEPSEDIFSFGVVLYELCARRLPWKGERNSPLAGVGPVPSLPKNYAAELNELIQACLSPDSHQRPTAGELHLRGANFLEKGSWKLSEQERNQESKQKKPAKRISPYLLAAAAVTLLVLSVFWGYQNNHLVLPAERLQQMATPLKQEQEIDQLLLTTLEAEVEELAKRNTELEEENKQLRRMNALSRTGMENREQWEDIQSGTGSKKIAARPLRKEKSGHPATAADAPSKEESSLYLAKELEEQLNKIANPALSRAARTAWKQETMARFAEGATRILDITEGTPKQYAAGIFLNLLSNVPHRVLVKEVKKDQNNKLTEISLTMEVKQ